MSDSPDYPSSSNSSHSSRRLDSSSLMSSGSSDTIHISSRSISSHSSRSTSPEFLGYFTKQVRSSRASSPVQASLVLPSPKELSPRIPSPESISLERASSVIESPTASPTGLMADLQFGRCVTPISLPTSLPTSLLTSRASSPAVSSSSEDEELEAKRLKIDPDYVPSTASEGTVTAYNSPVVSEREEEEPEKTETETEEEESWHPSNSTSPEQYSSPEDD
jgi:hypothetical protein